MRWVWIGDSILGGMADKIASAFGTTDAVYVHHNDGWAVWKWSREGAVTTLVRTEQPDVVVLALGTNDEEQPEERFVRDVKDLTAKSQVTGARVVWIGPFNSQERNEWGKKASGTNWIDGMQLAEGLARTSDGVHFQDYDALAARTVAAVTAELAKPQESRLKHGLLRSLAWGVLAGGAIVAGIWLFRRRVD